MALRGARLARWAPLAAFAGTLALLAPLTHDTVFAAGNDASRWALVESLGDRGETSIEHSRFAWTIDRVTVGGHDYSNKPPLLGLVGAAAYCGLKPLGLGFDEARAPLTIWLLTLLLVGVPAAATVGALVWALPRLSPASPLGTALAALALAAGTIATSFATTFNNHTVAAALIFAALLAAWRGQGGAAGLMVGLGACVDVVPGLGFAPIVWAWLAPRVRDWQSQPIPPPATPRGERRSPLRAAVTGARGRFFAALAGAAAIGLAANLFVAGSPWLPKMLPGAIDWSSRAAPAVAGVLLPDDPLYPLRALFGAHGFFSVSPVLLFGVVGLALAWRRPAGLSRWQVGWLAGGIAVQVLFHALLVGSFGGWSYGFRYLIPVIPPLVLASAWTLTGRRVALFAVALAISIPLALLGAYNPWPPGYEQEAEKHPVAARVDNPVGGNAAAWLAEHFPGSRAAAWAASRFIDPDLQRQREYLAYFFWSKGDARLLRRVRP